MGKLRTHMHVLPDHGPHLGRCPSVLNLQAFQNFHCNVKFSVPGSGNQCSFVIFNRGYKERYLLKRPRRQEA